MILQRILRPLIRFLFLRACNIHVRYTDEMTSALASGKVIVCCNHLSFIDGLAIAFISRTPLFFAIDPDFSRDAPLLLKGIRFCEWLGISRGYAPVESRTPFGMRGLLRELQANKPVMLFPEGRINAGRSQQDIRPGLDWLARKSGAPILWAHISGAERSRLFARSGKQWRPRIEITF